MADRDMLVRLMVAAMRGSNPMGGPQGYMNDIPNAPAPPEQLPQGWTPPGFNPQAAAPQGQFAPAPPPAYLMPIPRFHIPPGKELNRRSGASV